MAIFLFFFSVAWLYFNHSCHCQRLPLQCQGFQFLHTHTDDALPPSLRPAALQDFLTIGNFRHGPNWDQVLTIGSLNTCVTCVVPV